MANVEIKTPRFYCDVISSHIAKGITQNGEFDVTPTGSGFIGLQNGTEAELFDNRPINQVDFDTSDNEDGHVLITIDTQFAGASDNEGDRINFVSILNHNMKSADCKVRIFAGNASNDITAIDGANADTADINWSNQATAEVVNADDVNVAGDNKSVVVEPAADGSTLFTFNASTMRYWGIQFEGVLSDSSAAAGNGSFDDATDLKIGCVQLGTYFDMPHSPDMTLARAIEFDQNKILKSMGGQKYGMATNLGRFVSSTNRSPFLTSLQSNGDSIFYGRISYDMAFSYIADTDLIPAIYTHPYYNNTSTQRTFVQDVWNTTLGNLLPFIFSVDKSSTGDNAESELIFARFDSSKLDMKQVAHKLYNIRLKIIEEF
ncbi:MAG: hypothetical protein ACR2OP_07280 [Amylibacter sp.]